MHDYIYVKIIGSIREHLDGGCGLQPTYDDARADVHDHDDQSVNNTTHAIGKIRWY
jgi:hypothetical protein